MLGKKAEKKGRVLGQKERGEQLSDQTTTSTLKHGGENNLIVWGCMGWKS